MTGRPGVGVVRRTSRSSTSDGLRRSTAAPPRPGDRGVRDATGALNARAATTRCSCAMRSRAARMPPGWHEGARRPGWWDVMVGPGKAFDTDRYFVICVECPRQLLRHHRARVHRPGLGRPVRLRFPVVTVARHGARAEAACSTTLASPALLRCRVARWAGCRRCSGRSATRMVQSVIALATHRPPLAAADRLQRGRRAAPS